MRKIIFITIAVIQFISYPELFAQLRVPTVTPCLKPFYHGVASGDPLTDRVILWTRVTPDTNQFNPIIVSWKIAADSNMLNPIGSGVLITDASSDYTVKVDATGLQPNKFYFYQFQANGYKSVVGRTKTAPANDVDSLRFAVVSCANYESGFFNVYKSLKERNDFDAVLCLGDYIYEYESGGYGPNPIANRQWMPSNEIISLMDYRARYSTYHLDDDLRNLHQQFPFVIVWDDHEFADNAWMNGATNHQPNEGSWAVRKENAKQAFFEWIPIRVTGTSDPYQVFRDLRYGDLVEFIVLDTRIHGRDIQDGTTGDIVNDPNRQMLGADQFTWLGNRLDLSTTRWKVLAQEVMMAPLTAAGYAVNEDQWDGYPAERERVFNHILANNIQNIVVLTGDIHTSWANDLPTSYYDSSTGDGSVGVEFVSPSVTAPAEYVPTGGTTTIMSMNGHIKYAELYQHGYIILDINKNRTQADYYYVNTIDYSSSGFSYGASFYEDVYSRHLTEANAAAVPRNSVFKYQTATCPVNTTTGIENNDGNPIFLGVYPNPATAPLFVHYFIAGKGDVTLKLYDMNGKLVQILDEGNKEKGVYQSLFNVESLPSQIYILEINSMGNSIRTKFVKK